MLCHGVDAGLQGKLRRSVEAIVDGGALGFGVDELGGRDLGGLLNLWCRNLALVLIAIGDWSEGFVATCLRW